MRNLFFLLLPFFTFAQIPGAVGDGVTDDTAAVQAWLGSASNLTAGANKTYLITSTLNINQAFGHTINWNGSKIVANNNINPMILIDKRASNGGITEFTGFEVDGDQKATRGFTIRSRVSFTNYKVNGFRQPTSSSPVGIVLELYNDADSMGDYLFEDFEMYDFVGASNGLTTDSWGASNGFIVYWKDVPTVATQVMIRDGSLHDSWGEDAGLLYFLDQTPSNGINDSPGTIVVDNVNIIDVERRNVKGFCGNVTYKNSTFTDPLPSNPNLYSSNKSGLFVVGAGGTNILVENCTFVRRGYDGRVIPSNTSDVEFVGCDFQGGADLSFTVNIGDLLLCDTNFGPGSVINDYNINASGYTGTIRIGNNNTGESGYVKIAAQHWQTVDCGDYCDPCTNGTTTPPPTTPPSSTNRSALDILIIN